MDDERVVALEGVPRPRAGAPSPLLLESEWSTTLAYEVPDTEAHRYVVAVFPRCIISRFGYPNDQALGSHPLYPKGLGFYGVFEVLNSRWLEEIDDQNRVIMSDFTGYACRHFVITFRDSTFECLADDILTELVPDPADALERALHEVRRTWPRR